jgi:flagellar FliJ protein
VTAREDGGLMAVRRVREVRERDSRLGLEQALAATEQRRVEANGARARLEAAPEFGHGTGDAFRAHAVLAGALAESLARKEAEVRRSASVAEEARRRWARDRQNLRTVEMLLERRDAERRAEQARREARDLDELATQGWLRARPAAPSPREVTA